MSDEQDLIRRCVLGDEDAFAELIDRYKVMVFNIADRMVHDSEITEDLAQEVFIRVYRGLRAFRGNAKLSTWIYQIAYRVCLEELQRPYRSQAFVSLDDNTEVAEGGRASVYTLDKDFDRVDSREDLEHWLGKLPPHYRMALTLYYLLDKSYLEIAEVMELPVGTVKTYLYRAKQYLKECILDEGDIG